MAAPVDNNPSSVSQPNRQAGSSSRILTQRSGDNAASSLDRFIEWRMAGGASDRERQKADLAQCVEVLRAMSVDEGERSRALMWLGREPAFMSTFVHVMNDSERHSFIKEINNSRQ